MNQNNLPGTETLPIKDSLLQVSDSFFLLDVCVTEVKLFYWSSS